MLKVNCQMKCDEEGENCNTIAEGNEGSTNGPASGVYKKNASTQHAKIKFKVVIFIKLMEVALMRIRIMTIGEKLCQNVRLL